MKPLPPQKNPHPPISAQDKKRVEFAEMAIRELLSKNVGLDKKLVKDSLYTPYPAGFENKDAACIKSVTCLEKSKAFVRHLNDIYVGLGLVKEFRHAHLLPEPMKFFKNHQEELPDSAKGMVPPFLGYLFLPDEYGVHVYATFSKDPGKWYHLDVILSEDAEGNIYLRQFFMMPMEDPDIPPGAVC